MAATTVLGRSDRDTFNCEVAVDVVTETQSAAANVGIRRRGAAGGAWAGELSLALAQYQSGVEAPLSCQVRVQETPRIPCSQLRGPPSSPNNTAQNRTRWTPDL